MESENAGIGETSAPELIPSMIVVVIDEFADMMMIGKKVDN